MAEYDCTELIALCAAVLDDGEVTSDEAYQLNPRKCAIANCWTFVQRADGIVPRDERDNSSCCH
jgi:hypothetical protein